jgi:hypothetical protein
MNSEQAFFIFATTVNFLTAFWILGALFTDRLQRMPRWHLMGLSVGCLGLLFQAVRNLQFLTTGVSPADSELPVWFLKDLGYALIAGHSVWLIWQGKLRMNNEAPPATPAAPNTPTNHAPPAKRAKPKAATKTVAPAKRARK